MSKKDVNVNVTVDEGTDESKVKITITDAQKDLIPRVGDSMWIIKPYPVVDESMVGEPVSDDDEDGCVLQEDLREKPVKGYSYDGIVAKSTVLSDELDSVRVNGDYVIPLNENGEPKGKLLIFTDEKKARDKFRTLMNVSINEANRRAKLNARIKSYLEESLVKMHH